MLLSVCLVTHVGTEIGATPNFNQNVSSGHCTQAILYAPRIEILARALIPQLIGIYLHEKQLGGKFEYLYDVRNDCPIFLGRVYFSIKNWSIVLTMNSVAKNYD